ncbi:hypothetical protein [Qipengyuania sp. ASV99]|uniref:hypothetical protein n=1 Tax=Qipengyuania sp. ASV99 TaxID=3399681 RepID=UPI003A4C743E
MTEQPPRLPTPDERGEWRATDLLANRPFIICALYLCTYFTFFSCVVGVVLAHVFVEGRCEEWERSQFQYLIRTFWMMIGAFLIAIFCGISILISHGEEGFLFGALVAGAIAFGVLILAAARTVYAMLNAVRHKPMPKPRTLLL